LRARDGHLDISNVQMERVMDDPPRTESWLDPRQPEPSFAWPWLVEKVQSLFRT
jgi:hypothetical protein